MRLLTTIARMINSEYEFVALHRDIGETELKQGREIRAAGNLVYVDSAAVRAVKHGRVLIIEGIEKAERGIMPVSLQCSSSALNWLIRDRSSTTSLRTERCKDGLSQNDISTHWATQEPR